VPLTDAGTLEAPTLLYGILYLSPFVFDVQDNPELSVTQLVNQGKLFLKPPRAIGVRNLFLLRKCMARPTWQVKPLKTLLRVRTSMSGVFSRLLVADRLSPEEDVVEKGRNLLFQIELTFENGFVSMVSASPSNSAFRGARAGDRAACPAGLKDVTGIDLRGAKWMWSVSEYNRQ
jgi:hypothetical protein